jgi:hypothetical protein
MFFVRRLESSRKGGKFFRLRCLIDPATPYDKVFIYRETSYPPKRYKMRTQKSYFLWTNEKWKSFLRNNLGPGKFYVYYAGGFYLAGFVIQKKGNKLKMKKKLNGIILPLFLEYVSRD